MKIDCVVVADIKRLEWLFQFHSKLFKVKSRVQFKLILEDGTEIYYVTWDRFESWKLGRTYIHLADYIMANDDCFQHSGHFISRTELVNHLLQKEGDKNECSNT